MPETEQEVGRVVLNEIAPYVDDNDPNRRTHIVNPPNNLHIWKIGMEAQDIVDIARLRGLEVTALCGYKWVPKHNPEKFDVCEACFKIAEQIMRSEGE
jgi:hypothetical protein